MQLCLGSDFQSPKLYQAMFSFLRLASYERNERTQHECWRSQFEDGHTPPILVSSRTSETRRGTFLKRACILQSCYDCERKVEEKEEKEKEKEVKEVKEEKEEKEEKEKEEVRCDH